MYSNEELTDENATSFGHPTILVPVCKLNVIQNTQMILLSEEGAHGVGARCEQVRMLLPQESEVSNTVLGKLTHPPSESSNRFCPTRV